MFSGTLIRSGNNAKTVKGDGATYETAIMYLAPYTASGMGNVCPMAETAGCVKGCLFTAGRAGTFPSINKARAAKTARYFKDRAAFMAELVRDIERFVRYCDKRGVKPAVRLNGTSDIQWEVGHPCVRDFDWCDEPWEFASIFEAFPEVQFYDYTKVYKRAYRALPENYSLTLSYSMANRAYANAVLQAASDTGMNVSIVFRTKATLAKMVARPLTFIGAGMGCASVQRKIIDGDETDMRFTDPKGVIVGLYAKGAAKHDTTGFVLG